MKNAHRMSMLGVSLSVLLVGSMGEQLATAQEQPGLAEPPAITQVRAGDALMAQGRYREAAAEYDAAYAIDPVVPILERIERAYRLAGDYQRADLAAQHLGHAPAYAPPPVYVPPRPVAPPRLYLTPPTATVTARPGQGLLNAGVGLFVSGYAIAFVGGSITMGVSSLPDVRSSWLGAGGMLLIPVAGPFATIAYESSGYWAIPWAIIDGGLQLGGLAMMIAGGVIRANHPLRHLPVSIAPYSSGTTQGLMVSGKF